MVSLGCGYVVGGAECWERKGKEKKTWVVGALNENSEEECSAGTRKGGLEKRRM